jgi:hypothetical protein
VLTRNIATAVIHTIPTPVGDAEQLIRVIILKLFCQVFCQLFTLAVTVSEVGEEDIITQIQMTMMAKKAKTMMIKNKMKMHVAIRSFQ